MTPRHIILTDGPTVIGLFLMPTGTTPGQAHMAVQAARETAGLNLFQDTFTYWRTVRDLLQVAGFQVMEFVVA